MAFALLENAGLPVEIVDDIARTTHALTLLPGLRDISSVFERFASRDFSTSREEALSKLCKVYGRNDIMLFNEGCDWFRTTIIAFDDSDYFIMWFLNTLSGTTYLMEGEYDYEYDIFTVERFYYKSSYDAVPTTNSDDHAHFIHHELNGTPFSILATVMGEGSIRCTMSHLNETRFQWINPDVVCEWFQRQ